MSPADELAQRHTADVVRLRYPDFENLPIIRAVVQNLWKSKSWDDLSAYLLGVEDLADGLREFPKLAAEIKLLRDIIKVHRGDL